ncbi:Transcriptional regulatory protein-like protein [Hapsidospora chrysogenum ATCC 11550]|uniref:Transcriptional regulatory protein-like protein n=1 Tax=Hapsidospora chrysogenum (strain ATCC 11550 / CBS 779.69 / DSM 880 / IAM 14645 / JCM 23072 / IMI 49137) TaxID=857340 RepID=A0A086TFV1_HAPC1|nr:Transcriptional regulatory protein-like protein [Hapsidospora chrysogenum ATCC 11550]
MENTLPNSPRVEDSAWTDNQSLSCDEGNLEATMNQSRQIMDMSRTGPSRAAQIHGGQLSPASTSVDIPVDISSAPTVAPSASSSCGESWGSGNADQEENENDAPWEQRSDDALTVPKVEPGEDEFDLNELNAAPMTPAVMTEPSINPEVKQKRPRGRPRKHPLTPVASTSKVTKGRSKTGCITCRKRKKKCDEAKPRCMNCEKNAVVCEGYHEKQIWRSGKEKAEEDRLRRESLPDITLPPLFHGVETIEDQIFWKHYINNFSNVLTVEGEAKNAFKDIILHLANQHQGLMHSILSVSSKHIDFDTPYGAKLMRENPTTNRQALQERSDHHHDEAMKRFYEDIANSVDKTDPEYQTAEYQTILSARYGQILCRLLQTRVEGNASGEHRLHLQAFQTLIEHSPPQDPAFYAFITEFFQYHIYADDLLWHPDTRATRLSSEAWEPGAPIQSPRLLGVADGLLQCMAIISALRNTIRKNLAASNDPPVDYIMLFRAAEINSAIREWTPRWPQGDSRTRVGLLYKQMMFIYLFRTIYPPSASTRGLSSLSSSSSSTPQRRASMAASIVSTASAPIFGSSRTPQGIDLPHSCPSSRNPSRHSSMHEGDPHASRPAGFDASGASSPPPKRRPVLDDPRLISAVDESLNILESFKPSEPAQTLLLVPCLLVGIACFELGRRERVRKAIRAVRGYTGLRNCDRVAELLEEIWALMDEGDWVAVWDWQAVALRMGIDVPCT